MAEQSEIQGLQRLVFDAKRVVDGLYAGRHTSPRRGGGVEFHDYRAYTPGDDLRAIDWKVFGRTDRYYLKRFRQETDLSLHIAVDASASMDFAGLDAQGKKLAGPTKLDIAKKLAAALAMLVIRQGDRAGLALLSGDESSRLTPAGASPHLHRLVAMLHAAQPKAGATDLHHGLMQLHRSMARRGVVVLISDLLDETTKLLSAIDALRFVGSEVVVFQVLTPTELDLSPLGNRAYELVEPESGSKTRTQTQQISRRYHALIQEHLATLNKQLTARNCDHLLIRTDQPLAEPLRRYLALRSQR